jgi:hypothetical protein
MLCMFAMVFKCFSGVFSSVSEACFKCFICLQTYVATVAFECFKSRSGVTSLLLAFCYIVSVCPPPGVGRASIRRRGGRVLPNRRRCPLPLLSLGRRGPRVERNRVQRASVHPDVQALAPPLEIEWT